MEFSVAQEVYVFFISVLSGVFIGIIYDLLRVVRRCSKPSAAITDVEDILFWAIAIAIMFFAVYFANNGKIRWYQFFGAILGQILHFFTLSKPICFLLQKIIEIFSKIFIFFCKILLTPLLFMYNIIYKSVLFIVVPIHKLVLKRIQWLFAKLKAGTKRTKAALFKK